MIVVDVAKNIHLVLYTDKPTDKSIDRSTSCPEKHHPVATFEYTDHTVKEAHFGNVSKKRVLRNTNNTITTCPLTCGSTNIEDSVRVSLWSLDRGGGCCSPGSPPSIGVLCRLALISLSDFNVPLPPPPPPPEMNKEDEAGVVASDVDLFFFEEDDNNCFTFNE